MWAKVAKITPRSIRLLIYLLLLVGVLVWDFSRRQWSPEVTLGTQHYVIESTATREQTRKTGRALEALYLAYADFSDQLGLKARPHDKLQVRLFGNREEFRRVNRLRGWPEAFYRKPCCYAYFPSSESNPYHWMIHEAAHQLNEEVVGTNPQKWLEEGLAVYFGTARIEGGQLATRKTDTNTYPIWWLHKLATDGELPVDKANGSVIPLRSIVSGKGGPDLDGAFNLYYLHWWSLTHFLMHGEDGRYRAGVAEMLEGNSGLRGFERHIGEIERVEKEWYEYTLALKKRLEKQYTPPVDLEAEEGSEKAARR